MSSIRLHPKILIWLALLFFNTAHAADMLDGRVVGVHDGDTITLLIDGNHTIKVRLAQIDAPESKQPFGNQSKKSLSDMVFKKTIRVEKETFDKYGRTVGTLFVGDLDVNKEQVKRGMAWVYPKYAHDPALFNLEADARQASLGSWSDPTSMPPLGIPPQT
jgi:endonuclease YncB( thermonuclease family)